MDKGGEGGLHVHCREHIYYNPKCGLNHRCSTCQDLRDLYLYSNKPDGHDVHINPEEVFCC